MKIPNFINEKFINEDGNLTDEWKSVISTLITQLQVHLSDEGFKTPHQTTANIAKLNLQSNAGAILYDKDTKQAKINIDGTFKTITVT